MLRHSWQHTCLTLTVTPGTLLSLYCTNASVAQSLKALHDLRNGFHANQQHTIYKTNNTRKTEVILSCSLLQCIVFFFFVFIKRILSLSPWYRALKCFSREYLHMYSIAICTFVEGTGNHGLPVVASNQLTSNISLGPTLGSREESALTSLPQP